MHGRAAAAAAQRLHQLIALVQLAPVANLLQRLGRLGQHADAFAGRRQQRRRQVLARDVHGGGALAIAAVPLIVAV